LVVTGAAPPQHAGAVPALCDRPTGGPEVIAAVPRGEARTWSADGVACCVSAVARSSLGRFPEQIGSNTMAVGTVKFFNAEKGYGFISRDGEDDVFVHYSNIQGSGYRSLEAGQTVEFEVGPGRKGDEAQNVRVV
jgi:CspA family cold shock protein